VTASHPVPTVDTIIEMTSGIVLVRRRFAPAGWALPGGFVEYGERLEAAAVREAHEETGLDVELIELFHVYSDPSRDARGHTVGTVYIGKASGSPRAGDDAADAAIFNESSVPSPLAFDHGRIVADYFHYRRTGKRPSVAWT
jgi:8-oxo-dGTP diphosphatase